RTQKISPPAFPAVLKCASLRETWIVARSLSLLFLLFVLFLIGRAEAVFVFLWLKLFFMIVKAIAIEHSKIPENSVEIIFYDGESFGS
ncbi:MAG: hypothetical protein LBU81_01970, partial [Methanosarcinales archaeon]|nr:hypothetical protein [Methanosarcinales archaeon]